MRKKTTMLNCVFNGKEDLYNSASLIWLDFKRMLQKRRGVGHVTDGCWCRFLLVRFWLRSTWWYMTWLHHHNSARLRSLPRPLSHLPFLSPNTSWVTPPCFKPFACFFCSEMWVSPPPWIKKRVCATLLVVFQNILKHIYIKVCVLHPSPGRHAPLHSP